MTTTNNDALRSEESLWMVQVDFPTEGPFGDEMAKGYAELAHSIAQEPGLIWKLWTENSETGEAGGVYLFTAEEDARAYLKMHSARLAGWGITGIRGKVFQVNRSLSQITRGLPSA
ncbi:monooxygenase [Paeniglutamicibacter sulfureus]|uniref:Monooxygenase n=1 Tax=Paeniglutamicibacter sulfureus TaxID=43666 RepID=A0ABU2BMP1_9MICC|nr:monooxygenase [Paeniglutamicibacter sulfureus]MDO2934409.1 monooxygenase [Paeniglutamicibacter sulfureus]MDR7358609.1 hypothetical protein [Paeniglutamicibacter sulfureus]